MQWVAIATLFICCSFNTAMGQTIDFALDPNNHQLTAQCPGTVFTYKITPRNSCYNVTVEGAAGPVTIENITEGGKDKWKLTVTWVDEPVFGRIIVKLDSSQVSCRTLPTKRQDFLIPIVSVNNIVPQMSGPQSVVAGKKVELEYDADLNYQVFGSQDTIPFEVAYFEWKWPTGWNFTGTNVNAKKLKLLTDLCTEGDVKVRGRSKCGTWSPWETLAVSRFAKPPCPVTSTTFYVICEDTTAISVFAVPDNTLTGYTYEWEKPAGWKWEVTPGSQSTSASVKPSGLSGGTVRVRSVACGKKSDWCSIVFPLKKIHPSTKILGTDTLCTFGYQTLSIPPPSSSTITWSMSPSAPFEPKSIGVGDFAQLLLNSPTFGDFVTITFNIATLCGDTALSKTFFAGKPRFHDQRINGVLTNMAFVCPGTHTASLKIAGAESACAAWENSGANPHFFGCLEANAYLNGFSGSTTFIARATNVCGINDTRFFILPQPWGCGHGWGLAIYPNPAVDQVIVETTLDPNSTLTTKPPLNGVKLVNSMGNVVYQSNQSSEMIAIPLSGIPPGLYTLQSTVDGIPVSEIVQVKPQ